MNQVVVWNVTLVPTNGGEVLASIWEAMKLIET